MLVEHLLARQRGQAAFDIPRGRRRIPGVDIAEVSLPLDQITLVHQGHQRIANGRVPVRVELHGVPHNVRHLDELAVVVAVQGPHDATLHRLQSILQTGYRPVLDHVPGIIQEVLVDQIAQHEFVAAALVFGRFVGRFRGLAGKQVVFGGSVVHTRPLYGIRIKIKDERSF